MDRFIYCNDLHYGAKPISRIDNYNEAVLNKLEFILKVARKNQCIVLHGGDLTDTPKIKFFELIELANLLQKYRDVPFYSIIGNPGHDGFVDSSPLAILKMAHLIRGHGMFEDFEHTRVIFAGHGTSVEDMNKYMHVGKLNVLMTHQTIVKEPVVFDHTLIDDFKTDADIVTVAHFHPYQGILKRGDGKVFMAPGSIARKKRTKDDMERIPRCVYFSIGPKELRAVQEIQIPSKTDIWVNKKTVEIDDEVLYTDLNSKVNDMKEILTQTSIFPTLKDGIDFFGKEMKTEQRIIDYTQERIRTA